MSNPKLLSIPKTEEEKAALREQWAYRWAGTGASQPIPPKLSKESLGDSFEFSVRWFMCHHDWWQKYLIPWRYTLSGDLRALEIGCYEGMSSVWILNNLCLTGKDCLTSIDWYDGMNGPSWIELKNRAEKNITLTGKSRQHKLVTSRSDNALQTFPKGHFNFAYVDGDHSASTAFSDSVYIWTNLLEPGGIILWDDYFSADKEAREGVRTALKKFCKNYGVTLRFVGYSAFAIR